MEKSIYSGLWKDPENAAEELMKLYEKQREQIASDSENSLGRAKELYDTERGEAASAYRVAKMNTDAALAAGGLSGSGESVQRDLMNSMIRGRAMSDAASRYSDAADSIEAGRRKADLEIQKNAADKLIGISSDAADLELRKAKDDREAQKLEADNAREDAELELKSRRQELDEQLARDRFEMEKKKTENDIRLKNYQSQKALDDLVASYGDEIAALEESILRLESAGTGDIYTPDIKPSAAYKRILNQAALSSGAGWGSEGTDPDYALAVRRGVDALMDDPDLDEKYKKQVWLYAKMDGYVQ